MKLPKTVGKLGVVSSQDLVPVEVEKQVGHYRERRLTQEIELGIPRTGVPATP